jgi:iron(III) transport system substrate-binding protein
MSIDRRPRISGPQRWFALLAVAVFAAACSGSASPSAAPASPTEAAVASGAPTDEVTPRWGMTAEEELAWREIEAAAKTEGRFTYYSVGSVPADRVQELVDAFAEDYPDIQIDYLAAGNNSAIVSRISTEQESQVYLGDVSDFSYGNLVASQAAWFAEFSAPAAGDPAADWQFDPILLLDDKPVSTAMMTQQFGFWYNTDLVAADEVPQNYMDLIDPKWKDQIAWRQPFNTGGGNHTYRFATEKYGDAWVQGMQAQGPVFYANQDEALLAVANGEFAIGFGITGRQAASLIAEGQPLAVVWPEDIGVRVTNSMVVINNAPHLNAAKVFANWMLTDRAQQLWADLGQFPLNINVPPAEPWMADFTRSEFQGENLLLADELQALLDKAEGEFGG